MYLFRQKYGLAPTDPRVRDASDEEILLDLEADLAVRGAEAQQCPRCGGWTYQDACPCSPTELLDPIARAKASGPIGPEEFERLWDAALPRSGRK